MVNDISNLEKRIYNIIGIFLTLSLFFYFLSNYFGNQEISNYISPITAFASSIAVFVGLKNRKLFKVNWFLVSLACFFWGVADVLWMVAYNFKGFDPENSYFMMNIYLLPSLIILFAAVSYFVINIRKWHKFQLMMDIVVASFMSIMILWDSLGIVGNFFDQSFKDIFVTSIYLVSDTIIYIIIMVLISSARMNKIGVSMKIVIAALFIFVITDFAFVYSFLLDEYQANESIDNFYTLSIGMFGIASLIDMFRVAPIQNPDYVIKPQNTGHSYRLTAFTAMPVFLALIGYIHIETLLIIIFFMIAYVLASGFVQISIRNEEILMKEQAINEKLEDIIETRTQELLVANAQLEKSADTDFLTNMTNRQYFLRKVDSLIEDESSSFSIYYIDLDHFKVINDIHGHDMGDRVLKEMAKRFINWENEERTISRIGGDEFALIHVHENREEASYDTDRFCEELLSLFKERVRIDGYAFDVDASIGVATYPQDAESRELLIKYADIAMYQAKKNYHGMKCVFYSEKQGEKIQRRSKIEYLLKTINYDKEFYLNFQPQIDMKNEKIFGLEALLRWENEELGLIAPNEFIEIAEETDCIIKIGKWVIESAIKQITNWNRTYNTEITIGINLSPLQFNSVDLLSFVEEKINEYNSEPKWLDFEITENSAVDFGKLIKGFFAEMTKKGAHFAIDDFGTGYSSLSYISSFDIDQLKIAKELIDHIVEHNDKKLIIKAIILMAKGMNLVTIAEGVETEEQIQVLRELGCDVVQGYYYSKPLSKELFEEKYFKAGGN